MDDSIRQLLDEALRFRDERDWAQFHTPKDLALGLTIEAGELAELMLWKSEREIEESLRDDRFRERVREELADVQLFVLYLAHRLGVPLADAVREKLAKNAVKYPVEKSRGNAKKYTELG
jgi:NTP pyrophosphatase (non-canonical NTP hydrolase)